MIYKLMRYKNVVIIALAILLIICGIIYKNTVYKTEVLLVEEEKVQKEQETPAETIPVDPTITVYVCGSVKTPSNVTLPKESRVEDAVRLAGGPTDQADLNGINMAQKLSDEDMVYVPQKGEIIETGTSNSGRAPVRAAKGKLNVNRASISELDALPGVGPAIAQRIIEYRNSNGGFKSIEELNNVSGIGDEKYKEMKDLITVD